jgi:hypothetical protein
MEKLFSELTILLLICLALMFVSGNVYYFKRKVFWLYGAFFFSYWFFVILTIIIGMRLNLSLWTVAAMVMVVSILEFVIDFEIYRIAVQINLKTSSRNFDCQDV